MDLPWAITMADARKISGQGAPVFWEILLPNLEIILVVRILVQN